MKWRDLISMNSETLDNGRVPVWAQWLIVAGLIAVLMWLSSCGGEVQSEPIRDITDTERPRMISETQPTLEEIEDEILESMFAAFSQVESGGDRWAYNRHEDAVGLTQMRRCYVDEANRIVRMQDSEAVAFEYEDRWDPELQLMMFSVVQRYHNPELDIDQACDVHNRYCSKKYREAVKAAYYNNAIKNN